MLHASATRVFNLTTNDFFGRDDLLQGTPEGAYRVAGSIIALVMREGGGTLTAERAVGKALHVKAHQAVKLTQIAHMGRTRYCPHPTSRRCNILCRSRAVPTSPSLPTA